MATQREVSLKISALTDGSDNIRALANEVDELAKKGGEAGPEFQKLSDQLHKLADQQDLISQFGALSSKATETAAAFQKAGAATQASAAALREKQAALSAAKIAEQEAAAAVKPYTEALQAAQVGARQAAAEITALNASIGKGGTASSEQAAALAAANQKLLDYKAAQAAAKSALDGVVPAQQAQAAAVKTAAAEVSNATTAFTRHSGAQAALKAEQDKVNASLLTAAQRMQAAGIATNDLSAAQAKVSASTSATAGRVNELKDIVNKFNPELEKTGGLLGFLKSGFGQLAAAMGGAFIFQKLGTEAFEANKQLESLRLGLTSVYGSSDIANKQIEFLRNTANKAGLSFGDLSAEFIKYAAAAKSANIPMETTNGLFVAITKSAATLGLSGAKVSDMLNALGQMASKGVVQMEELRGQLGDALPGALPKLAAGLGVTTAEMEALSKKGELLASEVFPALQRALSSTGGEVNTMSSIWERFKNSMTETATAVGDTGIWTTLKVALMAVGEAFSLLGLGASVALDTIITGLRSAGAAAIALAHGDMKGAVDTMNQLWDDYLKRNTDRANKFRELDAQNIKSFEAIASGSTAAAKAAEEAAKKYVLVGDAFQLVGDAATKSAAQVAATEPTWTKLNVEYEKVIASIEKQISVAKASVEATAAQGAAMEKVARIGGDQVTILEASASATRANAAAQDEMVRQLTTELGVLKAKLDADLALTKAAGGATDAQRIQMEALMQSIKVKEQELAKTVETTEALHLEAEARRLAAIANQDNSKSLETLRDAYQVLKVQVEALRVAQLQGLPVEEQLKAAKLALAQASYLERDALNDQIRVIQANSQVKQSQISLAEAGVRLSMEQARTELELAKATGNEGAAREANNRLRQLEIELAQLQAQMLRAEAEATFAIAKAKYEEAVRRKEVTEAMEAEYKAAQLGLQIKQKQADIADETASRLIRLGEVTRQSGSAAGQASGGFDQMAGSMDKAASSAGNLAGQLSRVAEAQRTGIANADSLIAGNQNTGAFDAPDYSNLARKKKAGSLSGSDLDAAQRAYDDAMQNMAVMEYLNKMDASAYTAEGRASTIAAMREAKAMLDEVKRLAGGGGGSGFGGAPAGSNSSGSGSGGTQNTGSGGFYTININLNTPSGTKSTTITVGSQADADRLEGMLRQIESDMKRS